MTTDCACIRKDKKANVIAQRDK